MSGKAIFFLALGFSSIFIFFGVDFLSISQKSTNDMVENIEDAKALDIARSATEAIISHYWQNPDSAKDLQQHQLFFDNVNYNDGYVTSKIDRDTTSSDTYKITTTATYGDTNRLASKTVVVLYGPKRITEMASYSESSGGVWWTDSDTVKGDIYCRDALSVYNHPTFESNVYSNQNYFNYFNDGGSWADRETNHQPNVDPNNVFFNTELKRAANALQDIQTTAQNGGRYFFGSNSIWSAPPADTMYIELKGNRIDIKFSKNGSPNDLINKNISTFIPNKVIYADNYVVRLKGELDGQLLIACDGDKSYGKGKILLDDDIIYKDDPRDGTSDDLLGLVAEGYIEVADTQPNETDINIHASIYSAWDGLTAENASTKLDAGKINFFGSLIEYQRKPVGKFDPVTGNLWGYGRNYDYDMRLRKISPPGFPKLQGFNVLAWYEGDSPKEALQNN